MERDESRGEEHRQIWRQKIGAQDKRTAEDSRRPGSATYNGRPEASEVHLDRTDGTEGPVPGSHKVGSSRHVASQDVTKRLDRRHPSHVARASHPPD